MTALNALKPLHIDDPFSLRIAQQITAHPTDPYGFEILWVQWPQPVYEELTPPVVPYAWAVALPLVGTLPFVSKLWLFPFAALLALALHALLRRFAPGTEIPLTLLTLFSPAFLPGFNVMQDVPAAGLALTALALYFASRDRSSLALALGAGLVGGFALQTKYTAVSILAVVALDALFSRRMREAVASIGVALGIFSAWELWTTALYGQGMFFGQLGSPLWSMARSAMIVPLVRLLGGVAPFVAWIGLAGLGLPRPAVLGLTAATLASYACLFLLPVSSVLYPLLGVFVLLVLVCASAKLIRGTTLDWLLIGWLLTEVALYFAAAPFPAVRRVMGVVVAATFVVGRLASQRMRVEPRTVPLTALAACAAALGLVFWFVDLREAQALRAAPAAAHERIRAIEPAPRIWYVGHWGFQYYAEEDGCQPVVPDVSQLRAGDWLILPDRIHKQEISVADGDVSRRERLELSDGIPLVTGQGYYGGDTPLDHHEGPRLTLSLVQLARDVVPESAWTPAQLYRWARYAPPRTAAGALPALRRLLGSGDPLTRITAAKALAELGPLAGPAQEDLQRLLEDPTSEVRQAAAEALGRLASPSG
jgi:hypothetical protein